MTKQKFKFSKTDRSILIANGLDHFDSAIYSFIAPKIAPLFFPGHDIIVQLILAYSILCSSIITRPVGAFIFGFIAKHKGPIYGLSYSLIGVSFFTLCFGLLPTYEHIGHYAALLMLLTRMILGIFAAGERAIAKIYVVDNKEYHNAFRASYWYQSSTMVGIICASLLSIVLPWRLCFILGGMMGVFALMLRKCETDKNFDKHVFEQYKISTLKSFWRERLTILKIAFTTGISHITYLMPFVVFNSLVPLVTNISFETMMYCNTALLICDALIIFIIGPLVNNYSVKSIMIFSLIMLIIITPLIGMLHNATLLLVSFIRIWIVFWGVVLATPMNLYYKQLQQNNPNRYFVTGIANALGASIIGKTTPVICFWLFHATGSVISIGIYLMIIMTCGLYLVTRISSN